MIGKLFDFFRNRTLRLRHPELAVAFAIQSHLTIQERVALSRLVVSRRQILEIGSYVGASACCFGAAIREAGAGRVVCVDTWNNEGMSEGSRDTYAEFVANTAPYSGFIVPVRGRSVDVLDQVRGLTRHLDLLFIDGDHSYAGVMADWEAYGPMLKPGSIAVFHDWGWAEGVRRVVAEEVMPRVASFDHLPNMWWGTIGPVHAEGSLDGARMPAIARQ